MSVCERREEMTMQVATPIARKSSGLALGHLNDAIKQLNECQCDADIQALSQRVQEIMLALSGDSAGTNVLEALEKAEKALKMDGQTVKCNRIRKMRKLLAKLPSQSAKKQRKMLRQILSLCSKNAGVSMKKRGLCGMSLCTSVACVSGSVLVLAGATALIAMAATGDLTEFEALEAQEDGQDGGVEHDGAEEEVAAGSRAFGVASDAVEDEWERMGKLFNLRNFDNAQAEEICDKTWRQLGSKGGWLDRTWETQFDYIRGQMRVGEELGWDEARRDSWYRSRGVWSVLLNESFEVHCQTHELDYDETYITHWDRYWDLFWDNRTSTVEERAAAFEEFFNPPTDTAVATEPIEEWEYFRNNPPAFNDISQDEDFQQRWIELLDSLENRCYSEQHFDSRLQFFIDGNDGLERGDWADDLKARWEHDYDLVKEPVREELLRQLFANECSEEEGPCGLNAEMMSSTKLMRLFNRVIYLRLKDLAGDESAEWVITNAQTKLDNMVERILNAN